jgi:hypothetical protein
MCPKLVSLVWLGFFLVFGLGFGVARDRFATEFGWLFRLYFTHGLRQ